MSTTTYQAIRSYCNILTGQNDISKLKNAYNNFHNTNHTSFPGLFTPYQSKEEARKAFLNDLFINLCVSGLLTAHYFENGCKMLMKTGKALLKGNIVGAVTGMAACMAACMAAAILTVTFSIMTLLSLIVSPALALTRSIATLPSLFKPANQAKEVEQVQINGGEVTPKVNTNAPVTVITPELTETESDCDGVDIRDRSASTSSVISC